MVLLGVQLRINGRVWLLLNNELHNVLNELAEHVGWDPLTLTNSILLSLQYGLLLGSVVKRQVIYGDGEYSRLEELLQELLQVLVVGTIRFKQIDHQVHHIQFFGFHARLHQELLDHDWVSLLEDRQNYPYQQQISYINLKLVPVSRLTTTTPPKMWASRSVVGQSDPSRLGTPPYRYH